MADLRQRLQRLIAGQANVIKDVGDIITGDGQQTVRLKNPNVGGASDGFALVLDSTQPTGLSWSATTGVAGIMNVTGSDGVTVTTPMVGVRNATNDLVTGTPVARIDAISLSDVAIGGAGNIDIIVDPGSGGALSLQSDTILDLVAQGDIGITTSGGDINLTSNGGGITAINLNAATGGFIASNDTGSRFVIGAAGDMQIQGGGVAAQIDISSSANNDINVTTNGSGDFNVTCLGSGDLKFDTVSGTGGGDESHFIDGDILLRSDGASGINLTSRQTDVSISAGGTSGAGSILLTTKGIADAITLHAQLNSAIDINADNNDVTIEAGTLTTVGIVKIQPGATVADVDRQFAIFDPPGDGMGQGASITDPTTGTVVDAECRAALISLLNDMRNWGWIAST